MPLKKRPVVVYPKTESAPQYVNSTNAFLEALTSAPGNTYVTIPPADITQTETDVAALLVAQAKANSGEDGTAAARDTAWDVVITDVRKLVRIVENAADEAGSEPEAVAIIQGCGLSVKGKTASVKPELDAKSDLNVTGKIHLTSKAATAGVNASYEWQMSTNNTNFSTIKIATESRTIYNTTVNPGTKLYFRRRIILPEAKGGTQAWSQVVSVIVM